MKSFKILSALGLSLVLSACASAPYELPSLDIPESKETVVYPVGPPQRPVAARSDDGTLTFDETGIRALERYHKQSVVNYNVATLNAEALEAQSAAYNALIEDVKKQQEIAVIRQELLEIERRDHFIDVWFHRGLIALGILLVL